MAQVGYYVFIPYIVYKKLVNFACNKTGTFFLVKNHINDILAIKIPGFAKKFLASKIMLLFAEMKFLGILIKTPPGKSPCRFFYVPLCVITTAEGKKLHYFARKIFVGGI